MEISDDKIRQALVNEGNSSLLKFTSKTIKQQVKEILEEFEDQLSLEELSNMNKMLKNYKYVDEIQDLKYGSYLRWVSLNETPLRLKKGAIFCEIKFSDRHSLLCCKSLVNNHIFNINLEHNIVFQKLTTEEIILLTALDYISK